MLLLRRRTWSRHGSGGGISCHGSGWGECREAYLVVHDGQSIGISGLESLRGED